MKNNRWELLLKVKGGHKFYAEVAGGQRTGRIAIADESGRYPEDTDDGVLFYDRERDVLLGNELKTFSIPVYRCNENAAGDTDRTLWTGEYVEALFDVAKALGFTHVEPARNAGLFAKWVAVKVNDQLIENHYAAQGAEVAR